MRRFCGHLLQTTAVIEALTFPKSFHPVFASSEEPPWSCYPTDAASEVIPRRCFLGNATPQNCYSAPESLPPKSLPRNRYMESLTRKCDPGVEGDNPEVLPRKCYTRGAPRSYGIRVASRKLPKQQLVYDLYSIGLNSCLNGLFTYAS
jgi:hypothetical protein